MSTQTCPTCNGRGAVSNAKTGSPELCPNCVGQGKTSIGYDDLPFWYPINPAVLGALGVAPASVSIDNDSDFEWRWIIGNSTGAYTVTLTDQMTSRPLMPSAINNVNIIGTAQLPFVLPKPYLLRRTSTIKGVFTDTSGAGNTIQFCLVGYKIS